ncbi:MAG: hypothetical protein KZQ58_08855 [gamma proteobacterium symbiont of Bathyaustriella thionipta]|nr:hypothetical protein [gamma proteobacterium symbiont of Bathyaustriella thionipta]
MKKLFSVLLALIILAALGLLGYKIYLHFFIKNKLDENLQSVSMFADVSYDKLEVSLDRKIVLKGIDIYSPATSETTHIERLELLKYPQEFKTGQLPEAFHMRATGVELKFDIDEMFRRYRMQQPKAASELPITADDLYRLGLNDLLANFEIKYQFNKIGSWIQFNYNATYIDQAGFDISVRLGNISSIENIISQHSSPTLNQASVTLKEYGLIEDIFGLLARHDEISVAEIKKQMLADIDAQQAKSKNKLDAKSIQAVKQFITKPAVLTLSVHPEQPLNIAHMDLYSPEALADLLQLEINYSQ